MPHGKEEPVTAERIEQAIDRIAEIIVDMGPEGPTLFPIYIRLKDELAKLETDRLLMIEIRERAQRLKEKRAQRRRPKSDQ